MPKKQIRLKGLSPIDLMLLKQNGLSFALSREQGLFMIGDKSEPVIFFSKDLDKVKSFIDNYYLPMVREERERKRND